MAEGTFICVFCLLLSSLSICTNGTAVSFYHDAKRNTVSSSTARAMSSMKQKATPSIDIYLDQARIQKLISRKVKGAVSDTSRRELLDYPKPKTTSHDVFNPSNPGNSPSANFPPYYPTPTIVIIPGTNPATYTPTNPVTTPVVVPSATPVTPTISYPTPPITNPGASPVTNPVTTYPAPVGYVPPTSPLVTTALPPATSAPIIPGQTWCIARREVLESELQTALDYACGIGGADCSQIQPGASCYDPNTVENHASYAFNSYFQKNPVPTSCDFGGTALLINTNPSTGTCIYASLLMASPAATTPPAITIPPATTATATGAASSSGYQSPPSLQYPSNPASAASTIYGSDSPTALNSTASGSTSLRPFVYCIVTISMFTLGAAFLPEMLRIPSY